MKRVKPIIIFILLLLGMAYIPYIPLIIFKINIDNLSDGIKVLYNFMCNIVFMAIIFAIYHKRIIQEFKDYFKNFATNIETSLKYYFIGLAIMVISNLLIAIFFKGASANNEETIRTMIKSYPIYMIFSVSIYAPFVEESIFRRSIKDIVVTKKDNKLTKYIYILISGLVFAALHVVGITKSVLDYLYIIPYLALGISFAALYHRTDNLFSTIIIHSLHNTAAIILYFIAGVV